mgnify:CR=1 FL=1
MAVRLTDARYDALKVGRDENPNCEQLRVIGPVVDTWVRRRCGRDWHGLYAWRTDGGDIEHSGGEAWFDASLVREMRGPLYVVDLGDILALASVGCDGLPFELLAECSPVLP